MHLRFVDPVGWSSDARDREPVYPDSEDARLVRAVLRKRVETWPRDWGPRSELEHREHLGRELGLGVVQVRMLAEGSAVFADWAIRHEARRILRA